MLAPLLIKCPINKINAGILLRLQIVIRGVYGACKGLRIEIDAFFSLSYRYKYPAGRTMDEHLSESGA